MRSSATPMHLPLLLVALGGVLLTRPAVGQKQPPAKPRVTGTVTAAAYLPADVLFTATLSAPDRQLAALRPRLASFAEEPAAAAILARQELAQGRLMLFGLAGSVGVDVWKALGAVLGREAAIAVRSRGPGQAPAVMLVLLPREPELFDRLLENVHGLAGLRSEGKPNEARSTVEHGVRVYAAPPNAFHCRVDDALLLSNDRPMLLEVLAARGSGSGLLASAKRYAGALVRVPQNALAWAWLDAKRLRELAGETGLPDRIDNPLGGLLFGGWWEMLRKSDDWLAWMTPVSNGVAVRVQAAAEALPGTHAGFVPDARRTSTVPDWSSLDGFVGELRLSRDWHDLFAQREALLTLSASSDLANFATTVSTLFGGLDFIHDVLPQVRPPLQLVAAEQKFSDAVGVPTPRLPAFALIAPLRADPTVPGLPQRLDSGSLMALSLINLDLAQKGQPAYMLDVQRHAGQRIFVTRFADPSATMGMRMAPDDASPAGRAPDDPEPDKPPASVRYNFAPATAVLPEHFVIATSTDLLREVIDALTDGDEQGGNTAVPASAGKVRATGDRLRLDAAGLRRLLLENREALVINRMLEEDRSRESAETEIDVALELLARFAELSLVADIAGDTATARLEIHMRRSPANEE